MANNFLLTLDTIGPQDPSIIIAAGVAAVPIQLADLAIYTSDVDTTGYTMKIWGSVDLTEDPDVQDTEGNSAWISFNAVKQIKLSATDGTKTVYLKIKDDVGNVSSQTSDSVTLDMTAPTVVVMSGPTPAKISKIAGFNSSEFAWQADEVFTEYKIKVVANSGAAHSTGTLIPTTAGSDKMSAVGIKQVETATVAGTATGSGNITVTVTSALLTVPEEVEVAIADEDTASIVGGKIRTALGLVSAITDIFDITGATTAVVLTVKTVAANDSSLNIGIDGNSLGITDATTSDNTVTGSLTFAKETNITSTIKGADLETASAGDGAKVVKIFVKDIAGNWNS